MRDGDVVEEGLGGEVRDADVEEEEGLGGGVRDDDVEEEEGLEDAGSVR